MEFTGRYQFAAPPQAVWDGLDDPKLLKACLPGCMQVKKTGLSMFETAATVKIGSVKATFHGSVVRTRQNPPYTCTLVGEGQGGAAGFVKGEAKMVLIPNAGGTELTCTAKTVLGGKLAETGQRLVAGAARQIADQFFARLASALEGNAPIAPSLGVSTVIWMTGLLGVVMILLLLFTVVL